MNRSIAALAAAFASIVAPSATFADRGMPFDWHGDLAPGTRLEVQGVSGDIRAMPADGRTAAVHAEISSDAGPPLVRVRVDQRAGRVVVCTVEADADAGAGCNADRHVDHRHEARVDFTVRVPRGVAFTAVAVQGDVRARGLDAAVDAKTVNGGITVETSSFASASSVSGSIDATLGATTAPHALRFATVNGDVNVALPRAASYDVRMRTLNGNVSADGVALRSDAHGFVGHTAEATLGSGGARIDLDAVNGAVHVSAR